LVAFDQDGKTTVIAPERSLKVLATNQLDDGFMASSAVAGKSPIVRTLTHLYRIEE
jgi:outer membrane protein assembly factor BamB